MSFIENYRGFEIRSHQHSTAATSDNPQPIKSTKYLATRDSNHTVFRSDSVDEVKKQVDDFLDGKQS
jgi:hypothetical protein